MAATPNLHFLTTLAQADKKKLFDNLSLQKTDFSQELLIYGGLWLVTPFITNRTGREPMVEVMGYGWALVYFGLVFLIVLAVKYFQQLHKAVLSCRSDMKHVIITQVTGKSHPWYKYSYYRLKFSDPYLRKLYFPDTKPSTFEVGDVVHVEVSEHGKQVIKIAKATAETIAKLENRQPAHSNMLRPYKTVLFGKESGETTSFKEWASLLIPRGNRFITTIILEFNLLVFILMLLSGVSIYKPGVMDIVNWGGNAKELTIGQQEYWRLLTSTFVHIGIMHFLMNILGFILVAAFLEKIAGRKWFAIVYLLSGIIASLMSVWWHERAVSAGASGAIFGLYGFFLAILLIKKTKKKN